MLGLVGALAPALANVAVPAARAATPTYTGVMTLGAGPVHRGSQGGFWQSRFTAPKQRRARYTACVIHLTRKDTVSCRAARTGPSGVSRLLFAGFVNAHPGRWVVRFFILGHQVAGWRFTVSSEGV